MKLIKIAILSLTVLFSASGCFKSKFDSNLNNPNVPQPENADVDLYLNAVQLSFAGFFGTISDFGMEPTRMAVMFGPTYANAYNPTSYDGLWNTAYTQIFKQVNALIPIANGQKKFVHVGMAKILKAYTAMTLVDLFGDIPFTEANLGIENTNPALTNGATVYAEAIKLLDDAIVDLAKTPGSYPAALDLFYKASNATGAGRWRKLAKTLKLRAYMQTRLVDNTVPAKISALITENDLINVVADDFEFKYNTKLANPNSRHPFYNRNYSAAGSAGDYMATYFMWTLVQEKGSGANQDPRTRYYFYRQRTNYAEVDVTSVSCSVAPPPTHFPPGMPYCLLISGYWGRDHGDNSGIPPDGNRRTTWGIYPAGGEFDASQGTSVALERGARGAGIHPIFLSTFTNFLKAEAALKTGAPGTPRTLLENGIRASLSKVIGYPATVGFTVSAAFVPSQATLDAYVNKVLALYDAATTDDQRMEVLFKEYYIALWGNGIDVYNNYRRTGKPGNMQFTRQPGQSPVYIRSHLYPSDHVNLNKNAVQKPSVGVQVFWDNNPANFVQ